jgi:uncharacterized protein YdaU (DUF1376 family)
MAQHKVDIYMPLYVRDFLTSTIGWSAEERGHYLTLLMVAWDRGSLPAELDSLERLSQGVTAVWPMLADKFPVSEDGQRRNARLEQHRERCVELKEKRVEAGKRAAAAKAAAIAGRANVQQSFSNRSANVEQSLSNGSAIVKHPTSTSTSTPTSSLREERNTHTTRGGGVSDFSKPGWAADEWDRFAAVWNATERATPWRSLMAPSSWVDLAAAPGWLDRAHEALARLPRCQWFGDPVAVTRFFEYVDRILAGEFDHAKQDVKRRVRQPTGGNL